MSPTLIETMSISKMVILTLLLFLTPLTATLCQTPSEIKDFNDLESSIVTNPSNLRSLTEAFFPTNRYSAMIVEVTYYENSENTTVHPLNRSTSASNHVFRWVSTLALLFADPKVLEVFSLRTLVVNHQYADVVIAPFTKQCEDCEQWKRGLLSNVTMWVSNNNIYAVPICCVYTYIYYIAI